MLTIKYILTDSLFEINRYLDLPAKYRLAFREFGTCLGIRCHVEEQEAKTKSEHSSTDIEVYADGILHYWESTMKSSISLWSGEDDLKPITKVMYAAALIPGGERHIPCCC